MLPWLGNSDLVEDVCSILSFLLSDLDGESLVPYQQLIEQGLASPIAEVRTVCLEQAQKLPVPALFPLVWDTVGFEDLVVAEKASKLLERYARNPVSASALYSPESLRVMEDLFERCVLSYPCSPLSSVLTRSLGSKGSNGPVPVTRHDSEDKQRLG